MDALCKRWKSGQNRIAPSRYNQPMLLVQLLDSAAKAPTVAHPGEDLGYDLYALEDALLEERVTVKVRTGVAIEARHPRTGEPLGLLIRDRSSMALRGVVATGGVIDAGYRDEVRVLLTSVHGSYQIKAGDKIAQMIPLPVLTGEVLVAEALTASGRGLKGFGSSGR